jgi:hypothetical protein
MFRGDFSITQASAATAGDKLGHNPPTPFYFFTTFEDTVGEYTLCHSVSHRDLLSIAIFIDRAPV